MELAKAMANDMMREIGNKTREFYEFVLPPVDMRLDGDKLSVVVDVPGFDKGDIRLSLEENVLSIQACKEGHEKDAKMICNQRPNVIDKRLRLPIDPVDGKDYTSSAKFENGVLTVVIPVKKNGRDIKID